MQSSCPYQYRERAWCFILSATDNGSFYYLGKSIRPRSFSWLRGGSLHTDFLRFVDQNIATLFLLLIRTLNLLPFLLPWSPSPFWPIGSVRALVSTLIGSCNFTTPVNLRLSAQYTKGKCDPLFITRVAHGRVFRYLCFEQWMYYCSRMERVEVLRSFWSCSVNPARRILALLTSPWTVKSLWLRFSSRDIITNNTTSREM